MSTAGMTREFTYGELKLEPAPTADDRLKLVRSAVREVERYAYRELSEAEGEEQAREARQILRLAVGLRRMLDLRR